MTKLKVLLIIAFLGISFSVRAQEMPKNHYKFETGGEISLSYGFLPSDNYYQLFRNGMGCNPSYHDETLDSYFTDGPRDQLKSVRASGAINLTYTYRFKKWLELSGTLGYSGVYEYRYANNGHSSKLRSVHNAINIIPEVRFVWFRTKHVSMYSGIGIGVRFITEKNIYDYESTIYNDMGITSKITPIAIRIGGKKLYGMAELGFGSSGIFVLGIGYKF